MSDKKSNRTYTPEFIQEAMQLVLKEKRTAPNVAESLGIPHSTLRGWLRKYPTAKGTVGEQKDLIAELRQLKDRNRQLEMENSILKKAAAYFAQEVL
jgi:transposase-like protein